MDKKQLLSFAFLFLTCALRGMESRSKKNTIPLNVREFIGAELSNCGLNPSDIKLVLKSEPDDFFPFYYGWAARGYATKDGFIYINNQNMSLLQKVIKAHKNPFYQNLINTLFDTDIVLEEILSRISLDDIPHPHAKTMHRQEVVLHGATYTTRHEAGHLYNKDSIRLFLFKIFLVGTIWAIERLIFGSNVVQPSWKMVARMAAEATVAGGVNQWYSRRVESQADDFAIEHTKNPRELLAAAILHKNYHNLQVLSRNGYKPSLFTKFTDIHKRIFASHPSNYSRYKKFYAAAEHLYAQQALERNRYLKNYFDYKLYEIANPF